MWNETKIVAARKNPTFLDDSSYEFSLNALILIICFQTFDLNVNHIYFLG